MALPSSSPSSSSPPPSLLLALPTELRLRIYAEALTARDGAIRKYLSYQPAERREPAGLGLGLLRTCRLVYRECGDLLYELNQCFQPNSLPAIGQSHLPPPCLTHLHSLFLLLDATTAPDSSLETSPSSAIVGLSSFSPLAAMVSLRRLRVAVVVRRRFIQGTQWWKALLARVVERVPPGCRLQWGVEEGNDAQRRYVDAFLCTPGGGAVAGVVLEEVPRDVLMRAAAYAEVQQGALSGKEEEVGREEEGEAGVYGHVRTW